MNIGRFVRSISKEDAMKGHGGVARAERLKYLARTKEAQSACFKTQKRPEVVRSETEITDTPSLSFVRPKFVVHSLPKTLLQFDKLGNLITDSSAPICSRFGELVKTDDLYYENAQMHDSITTHLTKSLQAQEQQRDFYAQKHKGEFKPFGTANFEAPYKGERLRKDASLLFKRMSESLDSKDLEASRMGLSLHQEDFLISQRDAHADQKSCLTFEKQTNRLQHLKSQKVGQYQNWERFCFDYNLQPPVQRSRSVVMAKQTGRDGRIVTEKDRETALKQKWLTTTQAERLEKAKGKRAASTLERRAPQRFNQ